MNELFDYSSSWLNPGLKLFIVTLYLLLAYGYIQARRLYVGDLRQFLTTLFWMGNVAALSALLRYFDHGIQFGFTAEFSLKWFQSLGYLIQGVLFVAAVRQISRGIVPEIRDRSAELQPSPAAQQGKQG